MTDLIQQSVTDLAAAIRDKKISSVELVSAYIEQAQRVNPKINALVQFNPERALQAAKERDAWQAQGKPLGPLHGVPFTLKDVYNTKGDVVTAGCVAFKDHVAQEDGVMVQRLTEAGGILLGKSNTPELENGADTDNVVYGKTSNPYDQRFSAGGSSGGSAAIVAACGSAFDVGADTGGSLRFPAHYCGVATIRSTPNRIPSSGVVYGLRTGVGRIFTSEGPLSRYAKDLPLLLSILQGPDGIDPHVLDLALPGTKTVDIASLNVAYVDRNSIIDSTSETKNMVRAVASALRDAGANVSHDQPENLDDGYQVIKEMLGANLSRAFDDAITQLPITEPSSLLLKLKQNLAPFACDLPTFMQRWDRWDAFRSRVLTFFAHHDILLLPVSPGAALPHETPMWNPEMLDHVSYAWSISATILPVAVVRTGTDQHGLPLGIQIVARSGHEHVAMAVAEYLEQALGGWQMPSFL